MSKWRLSLVAGILAAGVFAAGCDDDGDDGGSSGSATEEVVIKTHVEFHFPKGQPNAAPDVAGEVLDGSSIGGSPFCAGGTFRDTEGNDEIGAVDRTFDCSDGTLRIGFTPGGSPNETQSGPWEVVSGTEAFDGLEGGGDMKIDYSNASSTEGRETFTGSVTP
jgi:hypothetical protein